MSSARWMGIFAALLLVSGCALPGQESESRMANLEKELVNQQEELARLKDLLDGGAPLELVAVRQVSLVDVQGKERARLSTTPEGIVQLTFFDGAQRIASGLGVDARDRPYLELYKDGALRAKLTTEQDGQPAFALMENVGRVRAVMRLGPENDPQLSFTNKDLSPRLALTVKGNVAGLFAFDDDRKTRAVLGTSSNGTPSVELLNKQEKPVGQFLLSPEDLVNLVLNDGDGKLRARLGLGSEERSRLELYDETGQWRATLGYAQVKTTDEKEIRTKPESTLLLFDKDGKTIYQLPAEGNE